MEKAARRAIFNGSGCGIGDDEDGYSVSGHSLHHEFMLLLHCFLVLLGSEVDSGESEESSEESNENGSGYGDDEDGYSGGGHSWYSG